MISTPGQLSSWLHCWDLQRGGEFFWSVFRADIRALGAGRRLSGGPWGPWRAAGWSQGSADLSTAVMDWWLDYMILVASSNFYDSMLWQVLLPEAYCLSWEIIGNGLISIILFTNSLSRAVLGVHFTWVPLTCPCIQSCSGSSLQQIAVPKYFTGGCFWQSVQSLLPTAHSSDHLSSREAKQWDLNKAEGV